MSLQRLEQQHLVHSPRVVIISCAGIACTVVRGVCALSPNDRGGINQYNTADGPGDKVVSERQVCSGRKSGSHIHPEYLRTEHMQPNTCSGCCRVKQGTGRSAKQIALSTLEIQIAGDLQLLVPCRTTASCKPAAPCGGETEVLGACRAPLVPGRPCSQQRES